MNETPKIVRGVLNPDGTLVLDERPSLPAGRVEVTIRPLEKQGEAEDWWAYMQRARAELEAAGHGFRTKEEIDADIENLRDWDGKIEEASRPLEGYGPYLRRVRARREAEGFPFRSKEEIDAEMDDLRSWDDRAEEIPRPADGEPGSDDR
jgi:hypothetical protein